ncbi:hypothetical protein [Acinetobacter seifertii]|uniref:hypothetical protein n=1 Tax=Acinetobacter seifertii TaxID=1530123 RepID=UPI000C220239|nr:hypothetical protein [Acinetobacter seifertii]PJG65686.1 hypothetical protein CVD09_15060 [Acinetobacter seifertii]
MKNIPIIFALVLTLSGCMSDEDFAFAKDKIVEKTINTYLQDQYSMIVISDIKNVTPSIYSICSKYLHINKRMIKKQRVKLTIRAIESEYVLNKDVNIDDLKSCVDDYLVNTPISEESMKNLKEDSRVEEFKNDPEVRQLINNTKADNIISYYEYQTILGLVLKKHYDHEIALGKAAYQHDFQSL